MHRLLLLSGPLFIFCGLAFAAEKPAPRPNVIVILADDMGWSDPGCYGGEIATPHLDALARDGLRFTQFYNTARCCPTRAALLTGLYSHQAGVGHMMADKGLDGYRGDLNRRCVTLAEALRPAGYRSYATGKWHVTPGASAKAQAVTHNWPRQRGFDRYYGTIHGAGSYFDPSSLVRDNTIITAANDPEYPPKEYYYTDAIADHAVQFIREHGREHAAKPFFLYVAFTAAHWPMHAKEPDIAKYRGRYDAGYEPVRAARLVKQKQLGLINAPWQPAPLVGDWAKVKDRAFEARCMEVYAAMVDCLDQGIGRVVAELKAQKQFDHTLILYLQDNGGCAENVGRGANPAARAAGPTLPPMNKDDRQHDSTPRQTRDGWPVRQGYGVMPGGPDTYVAYGREWANVSNTPFREYKHWAHEGGISTPLIAHWPAGLARPQRGQFAHDPGHLIDIMATCLDLAGVPSPAEFNGERIPPPEGVSLRPVFEGKPLRRRQPIFFEHEGNRAVRAGQWKLVAKGAKGAWELYDMQSDRTETHDLAASQPGRVKELAAQWDAWAKRSNVLPWPWDDDGNSARGRNRNSAASTAARFELKPGDELDGERRPSLAGRAFTVTVELDKPARDGVLVAQGGGTHGFALYFKDGALHFTTRRGGKLATVTARSGSLAMARKLTASLVGDGAARVTADGRELAAANLGGRLTALPADGLQVGRDDNGAVGDYPAPFAFKGRIKSVVLTLE